MGDESDEELTKQHDESCLGPRYVVGIGASAGGLESLEKLFRNLPADTGMAFVVLQHLSPDFKSMMSELLGRDTVMTIHRAEEGMPVEADSVYLLPPKKEMVIADGRLRLTDKDRSHGLVLPIDTFLTSLARECGSRAIAIILSGSGSDGSRGVIEVARQGGFVISESPKTAKFDGMPASAQASGVVDEILVPEEIGSLLVRIATEPGLTRMERIDQEELRQNMLQGMDAIYQLFRRFYDIDFSVYKDTTVLRRVHRRVAMVGATDIDDYARILYRDPAELEALYSDLLIGVTQFFRDPEPYALLSQTVFPDLVDKHDNSLPLRAWISGCATGEEAYSIAIAIHEAFERVGRTPGLKLFATDVHKPSIEHAGRGIYSESEVKGIGPERLEKYFVTRENGYQISPEIRRSIVFAPHNVLSDAPFTDLDFVSCRNLLIYFQNTAQTRALSMFHYSLHTGGVLLLGGSESPGALSGEFEVINERARIYRKRRTVRLPSEFRAPLSRSVAGDLHAATVRGPVASRGSMAEQSALHDLLLNRFMPPSLLIDENRSLVESFGGAEKFLRLRARQPSLDVLELMDERLRTTLSGAIGRTLVDSSPVRFSNVVLRTDDDGGESREQAYNLTLTPIRHPSLIGKHHVLSFEALDLRPDARESSPPAIHREPDASRDYIRRLEEDLRYSRENLQATIEELETSNEELQATNEELIASNEELQSTNEELHSVNEELYTVNAEHQRKIAELAELNQDMNHLLENTDVATVFLDRQLRVRRFTSRVRSVFDLMDHDIGRPIRSFLPKFAAGDLVTKLQQVLERDEPQECETLADDGTSYLMRMLPYRVEKDIEGVVLMLVDVSSMEVLRERLRWMSAIVQSTDDAIIGQDLSGVITSWNAGAERLYGYAAGEAIGRHVSMLVPEDRRGEVAEYHSTIAAGERLHTRDTIRLCKDGSILHVSLTVSPVFDAQNRLIGISKIARDVSPRIAMENEIRKQVEERESFLATLSHELRNPLNAALNASRVVRDGRADAETRNQAAEIVERQISMTRLLLVDLLDMSRITQGKIQLKCEAVDLCELIAHVRETVQSDIARHARHLIVQTPEDPLWVWGDAMRLVQVQVNLINNAAKYSPTDTDVRVTITREDDWAVISVTDEGVGIQADDLNRIFSPFVQVSETQGQSDGGLGIGLTLVKALVEEHHGRVEAKSNGHGTGSTFRVLLPVTDRPAETTDETPQGVIDSTTVRPITRRIVLIEDIDDSRVMLSKMMSLDGHTVYDCPDGESGLVAISEQRPDIALVDIGLPGIDGYEVARRTRNHPDCKDTVLIALTGYGQESDVEKALAAGFHSHLVKPVDADLLERLIQSPPTGAEDRWTRLINATTIPAR
jgi:two-component system CheB/CheR fusion protein